MKTILIYPKDIMPNAQYMHDTTGRMDLLGQILYTGYDVHIPVKTRTPQELKAAIHPFIKQYRRYEWCNTPITLTLLDNANLSGSRQIVEANKLLLPFNIELVSDKQEIAVEVAKEIVHKAKLQLTDSPLTTTYYCNHCAWSSHASSLTVDYDDKENEVLLCSHCHTTLPPEMEKVLLTTFPDLI